MAFTQSIEKITGFYANYLLENRDSINEQVVLLRHSKSSLSLLDIHYYFSSFVAPLVNQSPEDKQEELASVLTDTILQLIGLDYLGSNNRFPVFETYWNRLILSNIFSISKSPKKILFPITNILYNICTVEEARPIEWLESMQRISSQITDSDNFVQLAKVSAWKSGLAQYRESALNLCLNLDKELIFTLFQIPKNIQLNLQEFIATMKNNPWLYPTEIGQKNKTEKFIFRKVSGFIGFNGHFYQPPIVGYLDNSFIVSDFRMNYHVYADIFGTILVKSNISTQIDESTLVRDGTLNLSKSGTVSNKDIQKNFKELQDNHSYICKQNTILASIPYSHSLFIVALA